MKCIALFSLTIVAGFSIALAGCGTPANEPADSKAPASSAGNGDHDHEEHAHDGEDERNDMEKMKAEFAKLSREDAASAEKQHVCPVSGDMLGTMGAPKKVDIKGQQVWICCDGCKDELLGDPDKFLAKLKK